MMCGLEAHAYIRSSHSFSIFMKYTITVTHDVSHVSPGTPTHATVPFSCFVHMLTLQTHQL